MEWDGCGLVCGIILVFVRRNWEKPYNITSRIAGILTDICTWDIPNKQQLFHSHKLSVPYTSTHENSSAASVCVYKELSVKVMPCPNIQPGTYSIRNKPIDIGFIVSMGSPYPYWHSTWFYRIPSDDFSVTRLKYHEHFPVAIYSSLSTLFNSSVKFGRYRKRLHNAENNSLVEVNRHFVETWCLHKQDIYETRHTGWLWR